MNKLDFENRDLYMEIGLNIAFYRKKSGLTQDNLAEKINISRSHLSAIEAPNIIRVFSMDILFNIARALSIDAYKLLIIRD